MAMQNSLRPEILRVHLDYPRISRSHFNYTQRKLSAQLRSVESPNVVGVDSGRTKADDQLYDNLRPM